MTNNAPDIAPAIETSSPSIEEVTSGILLPFMPQWAELLLISILMCYLVICAGIILSKAGRHSFWAILLLIPYVQIIAIWVFALTKWPRRHL